MLMALTPDETEALAQYAQMRVQGMNHQAAVAAVNLARVLADKDELTKAFVARLKRAAP
jgi:hypothetical protein